MSWMYRACREILPSGDEYWCVREVFYTNSGKRMGWTKNPVEPSGDTKKELIDDLEMMLADIKGYKSFTLKADDAVNDLQPSDSKPSKGNSKAPNSSRPTNKRTGDT